MKRLSCPHCQNKVLYRVRRGKRRCKKCRYEWTPNIAGMKLTKWQWKKILLWFLSGQSVRLIAQQTKISHNSIEKALGIVRRVMLRDVPGIFSGTVEVDETYLGGQWKNKRKSVKAAEPPSGYGRATTKQPVFGILTRQGKVFARLVNDTEARDLLPIITKRVKAGSRVCSDTWRAYTGLAAKGYVHRMVEHGEQEYVRGTNHINGLEGFWGYLKRKLSSKGGVQRQYLHLFLGEYVWRYNHRGMTTNQQIERLLKKVVGFSG